MSVEQTHALVHWALVGLAHVCKGLDPTPTDSTLIRGCLGESGRGKMIPRCGFESVCFFFGEISDLVCSSSLPSEARVEAAAALGFLCRAHVRNGTVCLDAGLLPRLLPLFVCETCDLFVGGCLMRLIFRHCSELNGQSLEPSLLLGVLCLLHAIVPGNAAAELQFALLDGWHTQKNCVNGFTLFFAGIDSLWNFLVDGPSLLRKPLLVLISDLLENNQARGFLFLFLD